MRHRDTLCKEMRKSEKEKRKRAREQRKLQNEAERKEIKQKRLKMKEGKKETRRKMRMEKKKGSVKEEKLSIKERKYTKPLIDQQVEKEIRAKRAATARPERIWDYGVIPYEIEANFSGELSVLISYICGYNPLTGFLSTTAVKQHIEVGMTRCTNKLK